MKYVTKHNLAITAICLPIISGFLFAGFDIQWWSEMDKYDIRGMLLYLMHIVLIAIGTLYLTIEK